MLGNFRNGRWLVASVFITASCSQGDNRQLTSPSATAAAAAPGVGTAGVLAEGDVRIGPGPVTIEAVRMDRQTQAGASILRQYANPGEEYRTEAGETIELWVEWVRGGNNAPVNPRFSVDWGEGEIDRFDFIGCGSCLLKHNYPRAGRYTVKVTLDDRVGTTVSRTFFLNSLPADACVTPTSTPITPYNQTANNPVLAGAFFSGSNLVFSMTDLGACSTSREVSALGSIGGSINPVTGAVTVNPGCGCIQVTAANSCGSTAQSFEWCE